MDRAELGNKHICSSCNTKFYDLKKEIPVCPKCGQEIIIKVKPRLGRPPLNKNALNIQKVTKVEESQIKEEVVDKDEDIIESEMEDLISIDDIDENIIDEENDINIDIDDDEENAENLEDIADLDIENKEEDNGI